MMMTYLTAVTFFQTPSYVTYGLPEDFDFDSEDIPDLCAIADLYPPGIEMSLSVWVAGPEAVWVVDELDVGFGFEVGFE